MKKLIGKLVNPGTVNLSSKLGSKGAFFAFNFYLINTLSVEDLARFALFYATLRILTFFGVNSMNITRFDDLRSEFTGQKAQAGTVYEVLMSLLLNHLLLFVLSSFFLNDFSLVFQVNLASLTFSLIRLLADFSRFDGKVSGSIWIEDIFFTIVFIVLTVVLIEFMNPLQGFTLAIVFAGLVSSLCALVVYRRKLSQFGVTFSWVGEDLEKGTSFSIRNSAF